MSEHTQHLKELFAKAASIDDPAKRGNFLAQACENEPALRKQSRSRAGRKPKQMLGGNQGYDYHSLPARAVELFTLLCGLVKC